VWYHIPSFLLTNGGIKMTNPDSMLSPEMLAQRIRILQDRKDLASSSLTSLLREASQLMTASTTAKTLAKSRYFERKFMIVKKNILPLIQYVQNIEKLLQRAMDVNANASPN